MARMTFTVRIDEETMRRLEVIAQVTGTTVAALTRDILDTGSIKMLNPAEIEIYLSQQREMLYEAARKIKEHTDGQ